MNVNSQSLMRRNNVIELNPVKCEKDYNNIIKKSSNVSFEDFREYWDIPNDKLCNKIYDFINNIEPTPKIEIHPEECKKYYISIIEPRTKILYDDYIEYLNMNSIDTCEEIFNYKF